MSNTLILIAFELGIGAIGGFFIGYVIKKVLVSRDNKTKRER